MNESSSLRDATVQEIQLELLRRTQFNALDGEQVVASLLRHRDLWLAVLLDRPGVPDYARTEPIAHIRTHQATGFARQSLERRHTLRLDRDPCSSPRLARIAEDEDWAGEIYVYENQEEIDRALGTGRDGYGLLTVWWD